MAGTLNSSGLETRRKDKTLEEQHRGEWRREAEDDAVVETGERSLEISGC